MTLAVPSMVVGTYLQSLGLIQSTSPDSAWWWMIGKKVAPSAGVSPENAAFLFDTTGTTDGKLMAGEAITHPGIQIIVRGRSYTTVRRKGMAIQNALAAVGRVTVTVGSDTVVFQSFTLTAALAHLGQEQDSNRDQFSLNGTVTLQ